MTASWCDPHSVPKCHKLSQNYISLCPSERWHSWAGPQGPDMWQPPCPTGCQGTKWGDQQSQVPMVSWREGPLLLPAWCHPQVPRDAVLSGHRETTTPQECCAAGGSPGYPGAQESPRYFGTVARKHNLPEKYPPPLHTYHAGLLLLQPASLSCVPQATREEAAVLSSGLEPGCRKEQAAPLPAPGLHRVLAMAP